MTWLTPKLRLWTMALSVAILGWLDLQILLHRGRPGDTLIHNMDMVLTSLWLLLILAYGLFRERFRNRGISITNVAFWVGLTVIASQTERRGLHNVALFFEATAYALLGSIAWRLLESVDPEKESELQERSLAEESEWNVPAPYAFLLVIWVAFGVFAYLNSKPPVHWCSFAMFSLPAFWFAYRLVKCLREESSDRE